MSKRKVHVWRRYEGDGHYSTQCGMRLAEEDPSRLTPTPNDLGGATCFHCLKDVRDHSLWRAEAEAKTARAATELIESLRRKAAKRRRRSAS